MTDDEIDTVLDALIPDGTIIKRRDAGRLIFRAGMRRAAEIARSQATAAPFDQWEYAINIGYRDAAREIERAASEPPAA